MKWESFWLTPIPLSLMFDDREALVCDDERKGTAIQNSTPFILAHHALSLAAVFEYDPRCSKKYASLISRHAIATPTIDQPQSLSSMCRDSALDPRSLFLPSCSLSAPLLRSRSYTHTSSATPLHLSGASVLTFCLFLPHDGRLHFLRPLKLGAGLRVFLLLGHTC
jgi:hypothetical protein